MLRKSNAIISKMILLIISFIVIFSIIPLSTLAGDDTCIRVGIYDVDGFYGTGDSGAPYGYGFDYLKELSKYSGLKFEYVYGTLSECIERLENGQIDMLDGIQYCEEFDKKFLYSNFSSGTSYGKLYTKLKCTDLSQLNDIKVGLIKNNKLNEDFRDFKSKSGITVTEVIFHDQNSIKAALEAGTIDAIVANDMLKPYDKKEVARFSPMPFYILTSKDNFSLMNKINDTLEQILILKPSLNSELYSKHFGNESIDLELTESEMKYIKNREPITVVYDSFWEPLESCDPKTNMPVGINIDILKRISEITGLKFEFINGFSYEEAIQYVSTGKADMLLCYDTNPKKALELNVLLSETFLDTPIAIVGRDYNLTEDSVFAIPEFYPMHIEYIQKNFPDNKIVLLPHINDCFSAIQNKRADFTIENIFVANNLIRNYKYGPLAIYTVTTMKEKLSFALREDIDFQLISILNKSILSIPYSEKENIILTHTINMPTEQGVEHFIVTYRVEIMYVIEILTIIVIFGLTFIIISQRRIKRKLWTMAYIDPLTKLPNLIRFKKDAKKILENNKDNKDKHFAVTIIDINKFNLINEIYGFEEGDKVLLAVRDAFLSILNPKTDIIARTGADLFIILISYEKTPDLEKYGKSLEEKFKNFLQETTGHRLRFALGRYYLKQGETDIDSIYEKVNYAHNIAKQNTLISSSYDYDDDMKKQAVRQRDIESKMYSALQNEEFIVYLQPKYRLNDEKLAGAEALVRWQEQDGKDIVYPSEFIPVFENTGFIVQLDMYMFRKVCQIIRGWIDQKIHLVTISINFSRLHLQNQSFVNDIINIADSYRVPKKYLEIELTESTIFDNETVLEDVLAKLHNAGFTLSMDDFGTGYSSLGLLKNLAVDVIKFDRTFFSNSRYKTRAKTVIENVIKMAKELGIHTVAEGVESIEHIEFLREIGCESVQGYYYARPMPAEDFSTENMVINPNQEEEDIYLKHEDLGKISLGRDNLGAEMPVFVYRLFEFSVREALTKLYGEGEMVEALRRSGRVAGRFFATEFLDLNMPFKEFMEQLSKMLNDLKIGVLRMEKHDSETGVIYLTVEDDLNCSGVQDEGRVICNYDEGFISGILYEYTQNAYSVVEIDCWANGANLCRFEARPK